MAGDHGRLGHIRLSQAADIVFILRDNVPVSRDNSTAQSEVMSLAGRLRALEGRSMSHPRMV